MFLPGTAGALFALYRAPVNARAERVVVFVPPFGEEMNKSRRMFTLCAEGLAAGGMASLVVDLYGTGDSEGDFSEARWETWRADVVSALRWVQARGHSRTVLLGLRMGALLALEAIQLAPDVERVIVWQPVLAGEAMITQFLRMDVAGQMLAQAEERSSTESLRRRLRSGDAVEVGGYTLAPALVSAIDGLRLESLATAAVRHIDWIEVVANPATARSPAGDRVRQAWDARGILVRHTRVAGPPFWSSVEISEAPELVYATVSALQAA